MIMPEEKVTIKIIEPTLIKGVGHVGRGNRKVSPGIARELFTAGKAVPVGGEEKNELMDRDLSLNSGSGDGATGDK